MLVRRLGLVFLFAALALVGPSARAAMTGRYHCPATTAPLPQQPFTLSLSENAQQVITGVMADPQTTLDFLGKADGQNANALITAGPSQGVQLRLQQVGEGLVLFHPVGAQPISCALAPPPAQPAKPEKQNEAQLCASLVRMMCQLNQQHAQKTGKPLTSPKALATLDPRAPTLLTEGCARWRLGAHAKSGFVFTATPRGEKLDACTITCHGKTPKKAELFSGKCPGVK